MTEPDLLLLDEPAAGLDLGAREDLLGRLTALAAGPNPAIVLVTHHLEEIPAGFDQALVLVAGRVLASGPIEAVLSGPTLSSAYGLPLGRGPACRPLQRPRRGGRAMTPVLVLAIVIVLVFAFLNGVTGAATATATLVASRAADPGPAVILAASSTSPARSCSAPPLRPRSGPSSP